MQSLDELEQSLRLLLDEHEQMRNDLNALREKEKAQREELMRTHGELYDLQQQYRALLAAHHLIGGDENRQKAKQQLSLIIQQVTRAMEALKN